MACFSKKIFLVTLWTLWSSVSFARDLRVTSSVLKAGKKIDSSQVFNSFGCAGDNISPDIQWAGVPKETKAFAVTMYDPDAPTGSGWWHWLVYNIPASETGLALKAGNPGGTLPAGAKQGRTDFGTVGYGGPCPPQGSKPHHYKFTVYALKEPIQVSEDATAAMIGFNLEAMALAKGTLTAVYSR